MYATDSAPLLAAGSIAFQGVRGAYSEAAILGVAARDYLGNNIERIGVRYFDSLVSGVAEGQFDLGMLPVENSTAGIVKGNHQRINGNEVDILLHVAFPVRHCLLGLKEQKLSSIDDALSHYQALGQCARYLEQQSIKPTEYFDTAGAAEHIARGNNPKSAAIASEICADIFGLDILARNIQDRSDNTTHFYVIAAQGRFDQINEAQARQTWLANAYEDLEVDEPHVDIEKAPTVQKLRELLDTWALDYELDIKPKEGESSQGVFIKFRGDGFNDEHVEELRLYRPRLIGTFPLVELD